MIRLERYCPENIDLRDRGDFMQEQTIHWETEGTWS
jgi:hypothetical protein